MNTTIKALVGLGATILAGAGICWYYKSRGNAAKGEATSKRVTPAASVPESETESVRGPKRAHRIISRVEINQPKAQECTNYVSLPDGIIVVTDKDVSEDLGAVYQTEPRKRPAKDGRKHRGGRGKKKSGLRYIANHKDIFHLLQRQKSGGLSTAEQAYLDAVRKTAKTCYDPQESRKARNHRRGNKRA